MITTVTLNPMLDKTVYVDRIQRGAVQRASRMEMVVGGKGVNVSRQLTQLGVKTTATGFIGGEVGTLIEWLLDSEGIGRDFVRVASMTREGVTYRESNGTVTAVFEPSQQITSHEAEHLVERVGLLMSRSEWIVCSGSSPSRETENTFASILKLATERSVKTVLDSYDRVCLNALQYRPTIIKMNKEEYERTFGRRIAGTSDYLTAFEAFLSRGATLCVITDGPGVVYAATNDKRWMVTPPAISSVNATGSGDSMVAGMLYAFTRGWDTERALAFGVAAGSCNAQQWDVANSTLKDITQMETQVLLKTL
jgi:1-phosphofructokinase family hexose kinase